jgi:hypothetical protein
MEIGAGASADARPYVSTARAVSQILFSIAIYLSDLNPLLGRRGPRHRSLFGLAPDGVCRAADIAVDAVSFYLAISPLPCSEAE